MNKEFTEKTIGAAAKAAFFHINFPGVEMTQAKRREIWSHANQALWFKAMIKALGAAERSKRATP